MSKKTKALKRQRIEASCRHMNTELDWLHDRIDQCFKVLDGMAARLKDERHRRVVMTELSGGGNNRNDYLTALAQEHRITFDENKLYLITVEEWKE